MKTVIIAAIAPGGVIGRTSKACEHCSGAGVQVLTEDGGYLAECGHCTRGRVPCNDIPWSYPEIDQHVEARIALDRVVVVGRHTYTSVTAGPPRFLRGRPKVVVSGTAKVPTGGPWIAAPALNEALDIAKERGTPEVFVCGGAQLYAAALPLADELDLTLISREYEGDVKFPQGQAFHRAGLDPMFDGTELAGGSGLFECVERRKGERPDLTFTRWVRR